jgi:hypothetical protein
VHAVIRLLTHLAAPASAAAAADTAHLDRARRSGTLPLVTAGAQLVPARQAAYVAAGACSRLLGRVDPAALTLAHPQLPENVCRCAARPGCGPPACSCLSDDLAASAALSSASRPAGPALP